MTRKEIQQWLLDEFDILIKKHGADAIYVACPKIGKNTWTYQELRDAIEEDEIPEDYERNPIDEFIHYIEYTKKRNKSFDLKHTLIID